MLDLVGGVETFATELPVQLFIRHLAIEQIFVEVEELDIVLQQLLCDLVVEVSISQFLVFASDARNEEEVLKTDFVTFIQLHAVV